jgi:hypothetical protein
MNFSLNHSPNVLYLAQRKFKVIAAQIDNLCEMVFTITLPNYLLGIWTGGRKDCPKKRSSPARRRLHYY